jgi:hypothetical protein
MFLRPLADPSTVGYLTELLGEEPVANASTSTGLAGHTLSIAIKVGPAPWLRQIERGRALLVYRNLPPAVVRAPRWFEDPRFACLWKSSAWVRLGRLRDCRCCDRIVLR